MQGIAQMLGPQGPSHGDPFVAELLNRTYRGGREATARFDKFLAKQNIHMFDASFAEMTLLHASWVARMRWQMALAYSDGVIVQYLAQDSLPDQAYQLGDKLCDEATMLNREAVRLSALHDTGGKMPLSPVAPFPSISALTSQVIGAWAVCTTLITAVENDFRHVSTLALSGRMEPLFAELVRQHNAKQAMVASLKRDWLATNMVDNRCDIANAMRDIARDYFDLGQKLWAPYLIGKSFTDEYNRQPTLAELSVSYDPWMLTDPHKQVELTGNAASEKELVTFWSSLADTTQVIALQSEVQQAIASGTLRLRTGRGYPRVPWSPQFLVRKPVTFGERAFLPGQLCALFVSQTNEHKLTVEMRRSGRVHGVLEALGHYPS